MEQNPNLDQNPYILLLSAPTGTGPQSGSRKPDSQVSGSDPVPVQSLVLVLIHVLLQRPTSSTRTTDLSQDPGRLVLSRF